jgi:transcriptional regulator with XRE-family HTH domain
MMRNMDMDWTRLGELLRVASRARGMKQQDVVDALGVKRGAIWNIETGKITTVSRTVRLYAHLVGWTDDSPERVLAGGEPVLADEHPRADANTPSAAPAAADPDDLSFAVKSALRSGPLLDSRVVRVRTAGGEVTATIVVRGEDGMSAEELDEALRASQKLGLPVADASSVDAEGA